MFHVLAALVALYVLWRLLWRLPLSSRAKGWISAIVLLASQHHLVTRLFFGSMASPEVPGVLLMLFGWAFGSLLFAGCLILIADFVGLSVRSFSAERGRHYLNSRLIYWTLTAVAMVMAGVGVREAVRVPDVRKIEITLPGLPASLDGFRLVQLTDTHASRLLQRPWMEAVVEKTNALSPDLIVITGDLVDGTVQARANDVEPLRELDAPQGVFMIPGNHEYYMEYAGWIDHFQELGLRLLLNGHEVLPTDAAPLVVAGITDPAAARFAQPLPNVDIALADAPKDATVILLSHRPGGAPANAVAGVDLQLSGHTHGGQILGLHWITQWANDGYVAGLYKVQDMRLYVSHGTGLWNGLPLRVGRPSEITEITLRAPRG